MARRILVIDDDEIVRSTIVTVLRRRGFEAHGVASGPDAIVLLQELPFGIVYCDVRLEDESGIDLLPTFQAVAPDVPVVMCSGIDQAELAVQALRAGAVDYVTKPFDWTRFFSLTESLLDADRAAVGASCSARWAVPPLGNRGVPAMALADGLAEANGKLVDIVDRLLHEREGGVPARGRAQLPSRRRVPAPAPDRNPPVAPASIGVLLVPRRPRWRRRLSRLLRIFRPDTSRRG